MDYKLLNERISWIKGNIKELLELIYLSHTRANIVYAYGIVCRFMHLPQVQHMETVMRIIRHFKGTSGRGILLGRNNNLNLIAYTIVDWEGEKDG